MFDLNIHEWKYEDKKPLKSFGKCAIRKCSEDHNFLSIFLSYSAKSTSNWMKNEFKLLNSVIYFQKL